MTAFIVDLLSWILIIVGGTSVLIGGIGILRFPDVYTRMHAASITDTLGAGALLSGMMLQAGFSLVAVKLFLMLLFIFFTCPTSTFALAHAALSSDVKPILKHDLRDEAADGSGDDRESDP